MEENSFIPLTHADTRPQNGARTLSRENQVFKKGSIKKGQSKVIRHHEQHESTSMQCTPVMEDGRVTAIDVRCGCGSTQRIYLEYDETI